MKRLLRTTMAWGSWSTGLLCRSEQRNQDCLTILTYHRVLPGERKLTYAFPDLVVTPATLRRHCLTLRERFEVLPLSQALRAWTDQPAASRPLAAITFDDGYQDNYRYAAPVLAETQTPATFFIIAGLIGCNQAPWYDRLAAAFCRWHGGSGRRCVEADKTLRQLLGDPGESVPENVLCRRLVARAKCLPPAQRKQLVEQSEADAGQWAVVEPDDLIMGWLQLAELARAGHEIASHGLTHEILPQLSDADLEAEIVGSRQVLQDRLGRPVEAFCYPNGDMDERVARAVAAAGYRCAVTTVQGSNRRGHDLYRLSRRFIHEGRLTAVGRTTSSLLLRAELSGLADRMFCRRVRGASRQ